jgi:hypothetical protein
MLTVDEIRRALEKEGELPARTMPGRPKKEKKKMAHAREFCKNHPERAVMKAKSGRPMGLCPECIKEARIKGVKNRMAKTGKTPRTILKASQGVSRRLKAPTAAAPEIPDKPRLVLAETFPCPSCGAQLMIERG